MKPLIQSPAARTALGLSLALSLNGVYAAQATQPTVVVTATRTPLAIDQTLSSVSVIERDAIEASGASDLVNLLRREAGVDIVRGGGLGQQASVFLRGSNSNQVLVLIDGVRVSSANSGAFAWEHLPLAQIERIEIVRGARAALYGSDAIGGVIQLFTRKPVGVEGSLGIGNHETGLGDVAYGWQGERGRFGLRAGAIDSEGFNASNPASGEFVFDPDHDGFTQRTVSADAAFDFAAAQLSGALLHNDDDVEFDQGESNSRNTTAHLKLSGRERPWQLQASHADERLDTPAFFNRFETRRRQLDWQHALAMGGGELLWGLSSMHEAGEVIDTFAGMPQYDDERDLGAVFAAWRGGHGAFDWELAARHDDYDHLDGETTGQAALGWNLDDAFKLRANVGEGFRAPSLNQLYSPGFFGLFAGNPGLQPEHASNFELAADYAAGDWQFGLRGYRTSVRDLIDFAGEDFQAINIGRARLQGVELEWQWRAGNWLASGNVGWQEAEDRASGRDLVRRPQRKGNLALQYPFAGGWIGVELHAAGPRPDFGLDLPGYAIVGLSARWPLAERLDLDVSVDNLFDRHYELVHGYNAPGTTMLLQLRWRALP